MRTTPIPVYWWRGGPRNFGDLLSGPLLKRFTGLEVEWAGPETAMLVMVGSVLEHLPGSFSGVIAGAGKLKPEGQAFPHAVVLGVRGSETFRAIGSPAGPAHYPGRPVMGDPALLANELVKLEDREYDLSLIPHWTDKELEFREEFLRYKPHIIRVTDDPISVVKEIGWSKRVVTSSLHGAIIADAFGIPRRIELAPMMRTHVSREGGLFKWVDYHSAIKTKFVEGVMMEADRYAVVDKQSELFGLFETIKEIFK